MGIVENGEIVGKAIVIGTLVGLLALAGFGVWALIGETWGF